VEVEGEGACSSRDGKRYGTVCYAMLEGAGDAMGCWVLGAVVMDDGGKPASERLRCDERSGLVDWDIAARLEKREKAAGALIVWLLSPSYLKREKSSTFIDAPQSHRE
jgi:hypothetical protein